MTDGTRDKKNKRKSARAHALYLARKAVGSRARQARAYAGIAQIEMGRRLAAKFRLKTSRMYFRQENGLRGIPLPQLAFIAEQCGVRLEWLTHGGGSMLEEGAVPPPPPRRAVQLAPDEDDALVPTSGPIADLWNDGRCNPLTPSDLKWLKRHLAYGDSPTLESLELSLRMRRAFEDPSEENERAYMLANRRLREQSGMRSYSERGDDEDEHQSPPVLKPPRPKDPPPGQAERRRKKD